MSGDNGQVGRLGDNDAGEFGQPRPVLHKALDAGAVGLLSGRGGEKDVPFQCRLGIHHFADGRDHGGDRAFHIDCAPAVDPALFLDRREGRMPPGLLARTNDIKMTYEQQGRDVGRRF